ncbi:beta-galactosidase [Microbacterium bovistercoris]|uniref:Beta-galactosidase n=1 Tax=Microbacterium bovistercoris TaxID=2293570 RepID=A0A371NWZ1_9MICO|nr:beta-galactosidase [Microbacterium bovistercoris]REJ07484.1 beta-galactosidase [Microbacterium bovistercoris]
MTIESSDPTGILTVTHRPFPGPAVPSALPAPGDAAHGLTLTDRAVLRDGVPIVPVSGELHFSRMPRERWSERLRQLRAAGVTLASTYVFWNHHSATRGEARFDGALDVGAFVDEVADAGLELVLRIGPWAHGESRNGGFPDWVQRLPVQHRSDDPAYLELVREWFGQLAAALDGRARPGGPIVAIQLENELYDRPEHLVTLKRLAREAGMSAPLWTATAWGGAQLPAGEVVPLFGGYADGFWADPEDGWDPSFRAHFLPSHEWDDPGVGADVRAAQGFAASSGEAAAGAASPGTAELHGFPPATCELGSGMAAAYHRRPVLSARDVAALAHVKIGNGSAWQGYYMFAGGRNPVARMQETQDTGYPNDLPEWGYDFHAPIGESGDLHPSAAELRAQHAFLASFGAQLGGMSSSLPDDRPRDADDLETLRWALRADGESGFVVISHHRPHEQVELVRDVQLRVGLPHPPGFRIAQPAASPDEMPQIARIETENDGAVVLPSRPVDILPGTLARWPIGLRVGQSLLRWATASAYALLPGDVLVLVADPSIPAEIAIDGEPPREIEPGIHRFGSATVVLLADPTDAWLLGDTLWDCDGQLAWDGRDVRVRDASRLRRFDRDAGWQVLPVPASVPPRHVEVRRMRDAGAPPADYGFGGKRHRAPAPEVFDDLAGVFELGLGEWSGDAVLDIDWAGDVGQLRVDGRTVDDRFWDGTRWSVSLRDVGAAPGSRVTLQVLPLSVHSTVWLPPSARGRQKTSDGVLCAVDAVVLRTRDEWMPVG